jgi:hypothetical protein
MTHDFCKLESVFMPASRILQTCCLLVKGVVQGELCTKLESAVCLLDLN